MSTKLVAIQLENEDQLMLIIKEFEFTHAEVKLICGYFTPTSSEDSDFLDDLEGFTPKITDILDLARFTISNSLAYKETVINKFTIALAEKYIQELRISGQIDAALSDYERLKTMGVISASMENNVGLIYSSRKDNLRAIEHYKTACDLRSESIIFKSNYAIIANRLEQYDLGLEALSGIPEEKFETFRKVASFGFENYAMLFVKAYKLGSVNFNKERFLVIADQIIQNYLDNDFNQSIRQLYNELVEDDIPF